MGSKANQCHAEWDNKIVPRKAFLEYQPNHGIFGRIPRVFLQNTTLEFLKTFISTFNIHVVSKLESCNNFSLLWYSEASYNLQQLKTFKSENKLNYLRKWYYPCQESVLTTGELQWSGLRSLNGIWGLVKAVSGWNWKEVTNGNWMGIYLELES